MANLSLADQLKLQKEEREKQAALKAKEATNDAVKHLDAKKKIEM